MGPSMPSNLERMIQLAGEFFAAKNDPSQISVTDEVMDRLHQLHPATMTEQDDGSGPIAWMMVIPTTGALMKQFIAQKINEQELLDKTPLGGTYDAVYLCSALVLPEYRGKGIAKRLLDESIKSIRTDHPIASLFYWAFSAEGEKLAEHASSESGLPLFKRSK